MFKFRVAGGARGERGAGRNCVICFRVNSALVCTHMRVRFVRVAAMLKLTRTLLRDIHKCQQTFVRRLAEKAVSEICPAESSSCAKSVHDKMETPGFVGVKCEFQMENCRW